MIENLQKRFFSFRLAVEVQGDKVHFRAENFEPEVIGSYFIRNYMYSKVKNLHFTLSVHRNKELVKLTNTYVF